MADPIKTIDAMFSCARESPSVATSHEQVMDAWERVKALALFGRATLGVLNRGDLGATDVLDELLRQAEAILDGVTIEAAWPVGIEPWLAQPEPEKEES